jgi:predicted translin family RNA/ssDNA-binding protein
MNSIQLPTLPTSIITEFGDSLQQSLEKELDILLQENNIADELFQLIGKEVKIIYKNSNKILFAIRTGKSCDFDVLLEECKVKIDELTIVIKDSGSKAFFFGLDNAIEKYAEVYMLQHFFKTGTLPSQKAIDCGDEQYLGAALNFSQELSKYVIGRACECDIKSISICKKLVSQLNGKMIEFDFRNGNLRRKYDGLKYALKNMEDVTYELSLVIDVSSIDESNDIAPPSKKTKLNNDNVIEPIEEISLICCEEIDAIRSRMDAQDKQREEIIKQSRDVQKLSKQSIFSIHRNDIKEAKAKLDRAYGLAKGIMTTIVVPYPILRNGAFANCLEEWAEAALTLAWVEHNRILLKEEMELINTAEYVGALSDFTGEIGRMAVAKASVRDIHTVKQILEADIVTSEAIQLLNTTGKYSKKSDAVTVNMKKVQSIVYDLNLLNHGGRAGKPTDEPVLKKDVDNE